MKSEKDFGIEDFQKKVWSQFQVLKSLKEWNEFSPNELKKPFKNRLSGCFFIPILTLMEPLGNRAIEQSLKRNTEFEKEAKDLLSHPEIRNAVCREIDKLPKKEILTTERFVQCVTDSLSKKELRKKFVIPLEPKIFAAIAFDVFETGIENFCSEIDEEK